MPKQNQSVEAQPHKKNRPKVEPAVVPEQTQELAGPTTLPDGPLAAAGNGAVDEQAARLADPRFQMVQRQAMAAQIGQVQGNHHLQRVVESLRGGGPAHAGNGHGSSGAVSRKNANGASAAARKTDSAEPADLQTGEEGLGGSGAPSFAPAQPPPNDNGRNGHGVGYPVQRQEEENEDRPTEAEKQAALAAARAAQAEAGQTTVKAKDEVAKSKAAKVQEVEAKKAAKQEQQAANEAAKGQPAPEGEPSPPSPKAKAPGLNGKGPGGGPGGPAPAPATEADDKAPASPEEDPGFQAAVGKVKGVGTKQKRHAPAKKKADEAQAAAVSPPGEVESKAQAGQVDQMEQAETPAFDKAAFKAKLMQRIEATAPKSAEEADTFKEDNKLGGMKGDMQGQVEQEKAGSTGPLEEKKDAPPDPSGIEPKPVTPLPPAKPGAAPPPVGAENAVPKPKGKSELETPLKQDSQALNQQMAETGVDEEYLATKSNEPSMAAAVESKREAQTHAESAPAEYRQGEADQISQAKTDAAATAGQKTQAMHGDRANLLNQVTGKQSQSKGKDEKKRQEVAGKIRGIYDATKVEVERILTQMDQEVNQTFDVGAEAAMKAFNDYIDSTTEAYKQERYGGWFGWARWIKDKFKTNPEINRIADRGKQLFLNKMEAVIDNVVEIISRGITQAKAKIADGKKKIKAYVDSLPKDLKQVGQEAANEVQSQFDELEQSVNDKQDELIDSLAKKYNEKLEAVNARVEAIKEANKGLIDRAVDAIKGIINTIIELKNMLLNVISRAAAAIGKIIKDPIGFLGNLIDGIKLGFNNFIGNIGTHLKKGLISWLTGSIAGAGITLPENFDLQGIFQLVMQILGLSFDQIMKRVADLLGFDIRAFIAPIMEIIDIYKAEGMAGLAKYGLAKLIGQERVDALMKVWDMIQVVMSGDFGKLWEMFKDYLSGLKEMVMDKIQEFIAERVIKAGVTWLLSLFNPAGAFIKACKMIYDVVMFFIENGRQIMALVNAIIDSITNIADGNISGAAKFIEETLAKAIPVAISFLARLLGLGNVSEKVQEIIQGVRGLVDRALNAIFNSGPVKMVAGFIKKVVGKVKGLVKAGVEKVKGMAKAGAAKVKGWAKAGAEKVKGKLGIGKEKKKEEPTAETEESTDVKAKVRNELAGRLNGKIVSAEIARGAVSAVYDKYKPQGLKVLDIEPNPRDPQKFDVIAVASPSTPIIAGIPFETPTEKEWNQLVRQLKFDASMTYLFATVDGKPIEAFPIVNISSRKKHAENVFVDSYLAKYIPAAKEKYAKNREKTKISITMNRTSCGPERKADNCTLVLVNTIRTYPEFEFDLSFSAQGAKEDKYDDLESDAVRENLLNLRRAGARISATNVWQLILKHHPNPAIRQSEATLRAAENEHVLSTMIDNINKEVAEEEKVKAIKEP